MPWPRPEIPNTQELMTTLCKHAAGNYRILMTLAGELLDTATQRVWTAADPRAFLTLSRAA
jgi:hypothetical protein